MTRLPGTSPFALFSAFAVVVLGGTAVGEDPSGLTPTHDAIPAAVEPIAYQELVERLQHAERRLTELEQDTHDVDQPRNAVGVSRVIQDDSEPGSESDSGSEGGSGSNAEASDSVTKDLQDRLSEIESEWSSFRDSQDEAKAEAKSGPTFEIGGRIHADYWTFMEDSEGIHHFEHPVPFDPQFGTDPEDRFLFRRIRLEAEGDVPDLMFWRLQVDFNEPQNPQMKDVYLGWELPYNNDLILGHQKLPIGLDALFSSRFTTFMERPLPVDAFVTDSRRIGAQVRGYSEDLLFNWQYGIHNPQDMQDTGRYIGDALQLGGYGRLAATPWYDETSNGRGYLHLGVAGSVVRPDGDVSEADSNNNAARFGARPEARSDNRWIDTGPIRGAEWYEQVGLEAVINVGAVQFIGEFLTTSVQRDDTTRGTGPNVVFHGGYVSASYFLTGEYVPWDREVGQIDRIYPLENFFLIDRCTGGTSSGWGAWQIAARFSYLDLTDEDIRGGAQQDLTLALNWWWTPYSRLQFNATRGLIDQHRPVGGFESGDFWLAGTRFAIDF